MQDLQSIRREKEIVQCFNASKTDCTHWTYAAYQSIAINPLSILQNYLGPSLCPMGLLPLLQSLYSVPTSTDCSTRCVLTTGLTNDNESCVTSVMLLDGVYAPAAIEVGHEVHLGDCSGDGAAVLEFSCCERDLPDVCFEGALM